MKGLIFTEFLNMVEETFSLELTEKIISASHLSTGGSYTTVGTYDHHEFLRMVTHLSEATGIPISELQIAYGKYLFKSFIKRYSHFISKTKSTFDLLISVNDYIHVEVRKLYPDAELPLFYHQQINPNYLILEYHSTRPFYDLAHGLILGCADYFGEKIEIKKENVTPAESKENIVKFYIEKQES